jgi:hypothetical protein
MGESRGLTATEKSPELERHRTRFGFSPSLTPLLYRPPLAGRAAGVQFLLAPSPSRLATRTTLSIISSEQAECLSASATSILRP